MKHHPVLRRILLTLLVILLMIGVGPFLVPVPPLEGMKPVSALADADSLFMEINGIRVHYKQMGEGEPFFVLLHGFGASLYSWQKVMEPLSLHGRVLAYDRPAFGLTERPLEWEGQNPYSLQANIDLLLGMLDAFQVEKAILVGNSAGGAVAMEFFLRHPERVEALVLVDAAVYEGSVPGWLRPLLQTPQMQHLGPLVARTIRQRGPEMVGLAWHDPSKLDAATLALYEKPLQVENWDRALWNFTTASQSNKLPERLAEFTLPILVVTGDDDRIVPTDSSIRLAEELPAATLAVIPDAGHVPHEEQPDLFMQAVEGFLSSLP
jgi:pimeloyl-ACP methyl ester carboxylesterase